MKLKALIILAPAAVLLALVWMINHNWHSRDIQVREYTLPAGQLPPMKIAVMGDFHFDRAADLAVLGTLKRQLIEHRPDLLLLVGDFTGDRSIFETVSHGEIVNGLEALAGDIPAYAVLGNHDNGRVREGWIQAFSGSRIALMENRLAILPNGVCIRGMGDAYSREWENVWIPPQCQDKTITLTHDPYGLIKETGIVETLSFAGHTHCGQIVTPWGHAPYVPTQAPKTLQCGAFENGVTTGGLGYSILPIRFGPGTERGWELVGLE